MAGRTRKAPLTRSEIMARVRGKDTAPEMRVRRALWAAGLRYRLHDKTLPGRPDIVFRSRRIVVLVHGCFWHGHQDCPRHRIPKTRVEWWTEKMRSNRERDAQVRAALGADGWTVLVLWECETESPPKIDALARAIKAARRR
ncbi:MAG: DNA mismatch endonuclease Vsr [Alphaproteobacteria bacterium]|nr:DNA mismatch endonuclease Vsr [Alphaproteobacteria bacterium]